MSEQIDPAAVDRIFKVYDVRGIVPSELTPEIAYRTGRGIVSVLGAETVAVGRDMRVSSPSMAAAMIEGIRDQGADAVDLSKVSTDALYFAVGKYGYPAGVMITASHNPPEYNGFKICREGARAVSLTDGLADIRDLVISNDFPPVPGGHRGKISGKEVLDAYANHCLSMVDISKIKPLKVAVDAGNGMAGETVPRVFKHLPCELIEMYFELDGTFPNHEANPIKPENVYDLQQMVISERCDLGVAFDGDADRMFLIDEKGQAVGGDMVTGMVAVALLENNPGATICYNLICSQSVPEVIEANGGRAVRTPVGHSLIKKIMREEDAIFGGEHSGHFYFRDNWYADSGLIAMLTCLQLISVQNKPVSQVIAPFDTRVRSGEINMTVSDAQAIMERIESSYRAHGATIDKLDGVTVWFPDSWFSLRASNTEPLLRLNVEGDNAAAMNKLREEVQQKIASA